MAGDGVVKPNRGWWIISKQAEGDFFVCTPEEGSKAFYTVSPLRAQFVIRLCISDEVENILALDIALRRNDTRWYEHLPPDRQRQLMQNSYYDHFIMSLPSGITS